MSSSLIFDTVASRGTLLLLIVSSRYPTRVWPLGTWNATHTAHTCIKANAAQFCYTDDSRGSLPFPPFRFLVTKMLVYILTIKSHFSFPVC